MGEAALDTYVKRVTSLYRDLIGAEDPKKARQFLIELVEENIREIEVVLEEHLEKDREKAQRTIDHHGFNDTRDGEAIRRHWLRCRSSLLRGAKMVESREGPPPRDCDSARGSGLEAPPRDCDSAALSDAHRPRPATCEVGRGGAGLRLGSRGCDGAGLVDPQLAMQSGDGPEDRGRVSGSDVLAGRGDAAFAERKARTVEVHAADILACGGFLPERVAPRAAVGEKLEILSPKSEMAGATGAAAGTETRDDAAADVVTPEEPVVGGRDCRGEQVAVGEHDTTQGTGSNDDLTSAHAGRDRQNGTNEANFYEDVKTAQKPESVDVTADSGDGSGLDNLRSKPNSVSVVSGQLLGAGRAAGTGGVWPSQPPRDSNGAGLVAASADARRDALLKRERTLLREIESLKAQGEPPGGLLDEMLAAAAELRSYMEQQQQSRAP